MSYTKEFGRADVFITFNCNSKWPEISNELFEHQKAKGCQDLIDCVLHENQKVINR